MAAPSRYTDEIADKIIERLADGESLRAICRDDGMPSFRTVLNWVGSNPEFASAYHLARDVQASAVFEDLFGIADDGANDWMEKQDEKTGALVGWRENGEAIRRSALKIDTRKWALARMAPKRYGERQTIESTSEVTVTQQRPDWSRLNREDRDVMRQLLEGRSADGSSGPGIGWPAGSLEVITRRTITDDLQILCSLLNSR